MNNDYLKPVELNLADYNLDSICKKIEEISQPKSLGRCAYYVRLALQAGDIKNRITGGLGNANDYERSLIPRGFVNIGVPDKLRKGDLGWFPNTKSIYGHITIWTGNRWMSDYKQNKLQPYNTVKYPVYILRAKNGYTTDDTYVKIQDAEFFGTKLNRYKII